MYRRGTEGITVAVKTSKFQWSNWYSIVSISYLQVPDDMRIYVQCFIYQIGVVSWFS
jgi:hypothetical protein